MPILLLVGERGSGKTTLLEAAVAAARAAGRRPGGVLQPGLFGADGSKVGSRWTDAATGAGGELGSTVRLLDGPAWKRWSFSAAGLAGAARAFEDGLATGADPLVLDEVGPLELRLGAGLADALAAAVAAAPRLVADGGPALLVAVRSELAEELAARFGRCGRVEVSADDREGARRELFAALGLPGS